MAKKTRPKPKFSTAITAPQLPVLLAGRCNTCRYWIDAEQMQHYSEKPAESFNPHRRECWAENPNTVPADRRVLTGPLDLCRHWAPQQHRRGQG